MQEKEIGKLLELLNEYENRDNDPQIEWRIGEGDKGEKGKIRGIVNDVYMGWVSELVVCSAYYGFIQRLVEQDKINFTKLEIGLLRYGIPEDTVGFYEGLLMLLAISDEPIDLLISLLKDGK